MREAWPQSAQIWLPQVPSDPVGVRQN